MAAVECMVVGCESSAYSMTDLTPDREWASLPGNVAVCNLHRDELTKQETEWMLERDGSKLYVGDSLRDLNEYILLGVESVVGYGTAREFSHDEEDGQHIHMRVRRRGDRENEIVLVLPSNEVSAELKSWVKDLAPLDD